MRSPTNDDPEQQAEKPHPAEVRLILTYDWPSLYQTSAACAACLSKGVYKRMLIFLAVFAMSSLWIATLLKLMAALEQQLPGTKPPQTALRMPRNLAELKTLRHTINQINTHFPSQLLVLYISVYLFIRAFMIPGSLALNILAGSLYPILPAVILVTIAGALGDYLNYLVSKLFLSRTIQSYFSKQMSSFSAKIAAHKDDLLMYLIFIRALAVIPGWFVNMASPLVGIKPGLFLVSTAVGSFPLHVVSVNAGRTLHRLQSYQDIFTFWNILGLAVCALVPMALVLIRYIISRRSTASKTLPL